MKTLMFLLFISVSFSSFAQTEIKSSSHQVVSFKLKEIALIEKTEAALPDASTALHISSAGKWITYTQAITGSTDVSDTEKDSPLKEELNNNETAMLYTVSKL